MALYVLNCSIDVQNSGFKKENLKINKQESILELIIEKFLGFDNVIAEHDDHDRDSNSLKKLNTEIFIYTVSLRYENHVRDIINKEILFDIQDRIRSPFLKIFSPPPQS